ncbi:MAG: hypothetical protein ACTSR8_07565 [Promethearchaeota archaeon]
MISEREVLKIIVQFGKREYKEKKPKSLRIYRIKSKSILKRGMLPNLSIKQIGLIHYLIVLDYIDNLRIYLFARDGHQLGGQNIDKTQDFLKELQKSTSLQYHLPKKMPKLTLEDISASYQERFHKLLESINEKYGLHIKFPLSIRASEKIKILSELTFGCFRSAKYLDISINVYKRSLFIIIALREIFIEYLKEITGKAVFEESSEKFYSLIALLLTNYYLKNEKNAFLLKILNNIHAKVSKTHEIQFVRFIEKSLKILNKNTSRFSAETVKKIFKRIFIIFNVYLRYQISFNSSEFISFIETFFNFFPSLLDPLNRMNFFEFHQAHYNHYKNLELKPPDQLKADFLSLMFTLLSGSDLKGKSFTDIIEYVKQSLSENFRLKNIEKMVQDAISTYIFTHLIHYNVKQSITKTNLTFNISIENPKKFEFQNFSYSIEWTPKNRMKYIYSEEPFKYDQFVENIQNKLEYTIEGQGTITLFLILRVAFPLNVQTELKHKTKILKFKL